MTDIIAGRVMKTQKDKESYPATMKIVTAKCLKPEGCLLLQSFTIGPNSYLPALCDGPATASSL